MNGRCAAAVRAGLWGNLPNANTAKSRARSKPCVLPDCALRCGVVWCEAYLVFTNAANPEAASGIQGTGMSFPSPRRECVIKNWKWIWYNFACRISGIIITASFHPLLPGWEGWVVCGTHMFSLGVVNVPRGITFRTLFRWTPRFWSKPRTTHSLQNGLWPAGWYGRSAAVELIGLEAAVVRWWKQNIEFTD